MIKSIIISLSARDIEKSKAFYGAIGMTAHSEMNGEDFALMVFSNTIQIMLLAHSRWLTFTKKQIPDAHKMSEMALQLSCESRDAVDAMIDAVKKAGGPIDTNPIEDHGTMYESAERTPFQKRIVLEP